MSIGNNTASTGEKLRVKRVLAGIPGHAVCQHAGLYRSKLTSIERGYVTATADEFQRIEAAIDQIVHSRQSIRQIATEKGISLVGVLEGAA